MKESEVNLHGYQRLNLIVVELIKYNYPEAGVKDEETIGINITDNYRVNLLQDNGVSVEFKIQNGIDEKIMKRLFIKFERENYTAYYYSNKINLFTRFYKSLDSEVESVKRALDIFSNFEKFYNQCTYLAKLSERN